MVLASGSGTNLQAILDALHGREGIEVVGVGSDKPGARAAGVETAVFSHDDYAGRHARDVALAEWIEARDADLVISVPDSGNPAAAGFARASGLPRDDGLIKNRYVARTFIQPGQELRRRGLRLKFNPLPEIVSGQRIVVVDDSIVRGNTTRQIVGMLRDAGAREVHLRISAPPIRNPCHYGVDMSTREEMIAHERTIEEIADELGADSLAYLSMEGGSRLKLSLGGRGRRSGRACFSGVDHMPIQSGSGFVTV